MTLLTIWREKTDTRRTGSVTITAADTPIASEPLVLVTHGALRIGQRQKLRVVIRVVLSRLVCMVRRVQRVTMRHVRVMPGLVVIIVIVVGSSLTMVLGCQLVMLRRLAVMLRALMMGHPCLPARDARQLGYADRRKRLGPRSVGSHTFDSGCETRQEQSGHGRSRTL
jgi:hypothetical protein